MQRRLSDLIPKGAEYIAVPQTERSTLIFWISSHLALYEWRWYSNSLLFGDDLKLQTAGIQIMDFLRLDRRCAGISPPVWRSYEQLSSVLIGVSYNCRASANESWRAILWDGENLCVGRTQMFSCWLEEHFFEVIKSATRARF